MVKKQTNKRYEDMLKKAINKSLDFSNLDNISKTTFESIMETKKLKKSTFNSYINILKRFRDDNKFFESISKNITNETKRIEIDRKIHDFRRILNQQFINIPDFKLDFHTDIERIPTTLPNAFKSKLMIKCRHQINQKNWNYIRNQKDSNMWFALECMKQDINLIIRHDIMKDEKISKNLGFKVYIQYIDIKTGKTGYTEISSQSSITLGFDVFKRRIRTKFKSLQKSLINVGRSLIIHIYATDLDLMFYE